MQTNDKMGIQLQAAQQHNSSSSFPTTKYISRSQKTCANNAHHVDHVGTQLVGVHVDWVTVGGDVNFGHHVEEKGLLHVAVAD